MPTQAQNGSEAGAIAFVKHYIDVFNYASNTGDVKELKRLSDPKCEGCNSYIDHFTDTYSHGGYFRDSGWQARNLSTSKSRKALIVQATVDAPETTYRANKNAGVRIGKSGVYDLYFVVENGKIQKFERNEAPK